MKKLNLTSYPEYKDSKINWLGNIPVHWKMLRNKLFLKEISSLSESGLEDLLTVSQYTGVTLRKSRSSGEGAMLTNAKTLIGYKQVTQNDLVMNIMLAWNGSLGTSAYDGIASPAYCVFRADFKKVNPWYLHFLYRTSLFTGIFKTVSTGVMDSRLRLYPEMFLRLASVIPPLDEQQKIVNFIQQQDRRIRRLVKNKKTLIELLQQEKSAAIFKLVTQGLNTSSSLRSSSLISELSYPSCWEELPAFRVFRESKIKNVGLKCKNVLSLSYGQLVRKDIDNSKGLVPESYETWQIIQEGDTVLRLTDLQNDHKSLRVGLAKEEGIVSSAYLALTPKDKEMSAYISLVLSVYDFAKVFYGLGGGCRQSIGFDEIKRLPILVPPVGMQQRILDEVKSTVSIIDKRAINLAREVEFIREYHARLITDAVTGKIDLRSIPLEPTEESSEEDLSDVSENGFDVDTKIGADEDELLKESAHAN